MFFLTKQGKDGTCISEYDAQLLSQYKNQIRFAFFLLLGGSHLAERAFASSIRSSKLLPFSAAILD